LEVGKQCCKRFPAVPRNSFAMHIHALSRVARALASVGPPSWGEQFAAPNGDTESPADAFAMKAGIAIFTAGGRKLGTVAGMP